ncbi:hypothetical protein BU23DRAFT_142313 [Bimuria novae-zelandiae CBS 107.79]|uniref:Mid2 domain-containing protein n=1 Tax=Bimuria novae-zelandiae CBS 107.79 TaxID=1447943 RepID=A0A6A5VAM7_9PLEO|nr:hypothetical protein BU23DRAFT_142313 [Bimuria novae-zelandiae CBS 107.79]
MERPYLYFFREQPTGTLAVDVSTTESSSSETFSSESSLSDSSSTKSTTSTASPASSGTTTVASQTSEPTHSSTLAPEPPKEKEASKAWIAGVVIGIAGLLAVAGMGFYLWRQRQQHAYGLAPQGPQITMQPGNTAQQTAYYPPQQVPYGSGASPNMQPVSPNISAYDAQTYYGQSPKPQEGMMYGGHDAYAENGAPPLGVGTLQMPQGAAQAQPHMAANMHELPELAPSSRR